MDRWEFTIVDPFEDEIKFLESEHQEKKLFTPKTRVWTESDWDVNSVLKKASPKFFPLAKPKSKEPENSFFDRRKSNFGALRFGSIRSGSNFGLKQKKIVSAVGRELSLKRIRKEGTVFEKFSSFDRTQGVDWKFSCLRMVCQGNEEFNWEMRPVYLTEAQINDCKEDFGVEVLRNTFEKLRKELLYAKKFRTMGIRSELQRLVRVRKVVVRVLLNIKKREDAVLAILTLGGVKGQDVKQVSTELVKLNRLVLLDIEKLKNSVLSIDNFIYFGENYEEKIIEDNIKISKIKI